MCSGPRRTGCWSSSRPAISRRRSRSSTGSRSISRRRGTTRVLATVEHLFEAALYVGRLSQEVAREHHDALSDVGADGTATFILGGQIGEAPPDILLVYPEGNYIRASDDRPFLQIGETQVRQVPARLRGPLARRPRHGDEDRARLDDEHGAAPTSRSARPTTRPSIARADWTSTSIGSPRTRRSSASSRGLGAPPARRRRGAAERPTQRLTGSGASAYLRYLPSSRPTSTCSGRRRVAPAPGSRRSRTRCGSAEPGTRPRTGRVEQGQSLRAAAAALNVAPATAHRW